ncbi:MAG: membrane protein [Chitinophagales bacterium]|nr:MAG: membrane protein [Chitinophagales bacterium]
MKAIKTVILLLCFMVTAMGQQVPIFSLYHENGYVLNPAITGSEGHAIINASYRQQWTNVEGAPRTITGGGRMPIYSKGDQFQRAGNFIGVGAYVMHDKTGPTFQFHGSLTCAYHISFAKINPFHWAAFLRKSHISLGLTASVTQYGLNASEFIPESANDPNVIAGDRSRILGNAGLGFYYYYDKFYIGFSAPQVIPWKLEYTYGTATSGIHKVNHLFLVVGGKIPFGKKELEKPRSGLRARQFVHRFYIEPMAWFRQVPGAPYQFDVYTRFRYKNTLWIGAGYRSMTNIVVDAGVMIKRQFKIGYAYDLSFSDIASYLGGSHEVFVSYHFNR